MNPWEQDKKLIEIVVNYDAQVVSINEDIINIEFTDTDDVIVETEIDKKHFEVLPYPIVVGTRFFIVLYRRVADKVGPLIFTLWPIAKYWSGDGWE